MINYEFIHQKYIHIYLTRGKLEIFLFMVSKLAAENDSQYRLSQPSTQWHCVELKNKLLWKTATEFTVVSPDELHFFDMKFISGISQRLIHISVYYLWHLRWNIWNETGNKEMKQWFRGGIIFNLPESGQDVADHKALRNLIHRQF